MLTIPLHATFACRGRSTVISTYAQGQHVLRGVRGAVLALVVRQQNNSLSAGDGGQKSMPAIQNVQWFRGGLVSEAHRLLYHSA